MSVMMISNKSARPAARPLILAALAGALLAGGCANRDSVTVGAIPDDYRTNHPIVISEGEETLDVPVGAGELRLSRGRLDTIAGFMDGYDRRAGTPVRVLVPAGSINAAAASQASAEIVDLLRAQGVERGNLIVQSYHVASRDVAAPIRISYIAMRARTNQCGRWPEDIAGNQDNKHWANFGCSYQNNLAAQIANPADLLGPRRSSSIDPENRGSAIDQYKAREVSDNFRNNSEIAY